MTAGRAMALAFLGAVVVAVLILCGGLQRAPEDRRGPGPAPVGSCHQTYTATPPVSIHCQ